MVAGFYKGLAVTVFIHPHLLIRKVTPPDILQVLQDFYRNEPFLRVHPFNDETGLDLGFFDIQACNDTNRADLFIFGNQEKMAVITRIDNLGKGASGAASNA